MKKLLGIIFLSLLFCTKVYSETCEKDLSYKLSWGPNYNFLYLDIFNSNKNSGKIIIKYKSLDQFELISKKLKR